MSIHACCDHCSQAFDVPDNLLGKRVKCSQCGQMFTISVPLADLGSADDFFRAELGGGEGAGSPFTDSPSGSPFAGSTGAVRDSLGRVLPRKRTASGGDFLHSVLASQKLLIAVAVGMAFVALSTIVVMATSGIGLSLIPGGVMLVLGVVILVGGLTASPGKRKPSVVKDRAIRALVWSIGAVTAIGMIFGGMLLFAKLGYYIPSVVHIGTPMMGLAALVALIALVVMFYHVLVLVFPQTNVFRVGGWIYVALTIVIPMIGLTGLLASKMLSGARSTARVADPAMKVPEPPNVVFPVPKHDSPARPTPPRYVPPAAPSGSTSSSGDSAAAGQGALPPATFPGPFSRPPLGPRGPIGRQLPPGSDGGVPGAGYTPRPTPSVGPRPSVGRDFDSQRRALEQRLGEANVVTVVVHHLPPKQFQDVTEKIRAAVQPKAEGHAASSSGGTMRMAVGPVTDLAALAKRLTFGSITNVNASVRMIVIDMGAPSMD